MHEYLVVRLSEGVASADAAAQWMLVGGNAETQVGTLREAGDYYVALKRKPPVVVLAPANRVVLTSVQVPAKQLRYAKQALPFLVEEKLADDIEDVHIAMGPVVKGQAVPVAVARHFDVINWLDGLYSVGLPTTWLVPEALATPWQPGRIRVFLDNDSHCLIRDGQWQGMACELDNLGLALQSLLKVDGEAAATAVDKIELVYSSEEPQRVHAEALRDALRSQLEVDIQLLAYRESSAEVLASNAVAGLSDSINFLQGGYSVKTPGLRGTLKPRKVALSFAACLAVYLTATLGSGLWFDWRADQLKAESISQYRAWFPQAQRVFDPRRQLQSKITSGAGEGSELLLAYIGEVAQGWQEQDANLELQAMEYEAQSGSMTLQLAAPAADALAAMQAQLQKRGLRSELKSVSQRGEQVTGRLMLGGIH